MKKGLTRLERNWVLYDVGNSAFTMLIATIIPIYFNSLAESGGLSSTQYLAYWGYAASVSTLIIVLLGPIFGTLADTKDYKKPIFLAAIAIGSIACVALGFVHQWMLFLVIFIVAKVGYSGSLIFYDSMLSDVTTEERMDEVSSQGYAWGYIGSCIPFVLSIAVVLGADKIGISMTTAMAIAFVITALWWVGMTAPLMRVYRQKNYVENQKNAFADSFRRIGRTFGSLREQKGIFLFLLAYFCYIDGVYTIIDMATAYGAALGLDSTGLLLALLVTQIVAFPFAILFGKLAKKYAAHRLITICITAYLFIALYAITLHSQAQFWLLAVLVGMFQGGIQALTRSYFTKIIPSEQSGEYFGLLDICGKGASFVGTAMVGVISQVTGNANLGVGTLAVLFLFGIMLFRAAVRENEKA